MPLRIAPERRYCADPVTDLSLRPTPPLATLHSYCTGRQC